GDHTFTDSPMAPRPGTGETIEAKSMIPFGGAVAYGLSPERLEVIGEVYGGIPLGGENYFPGEAIVGLKMYLARNSFLSFGGGLGIFPDKGASPDARAFIAIVFEPNIGD